MAKANYLVSFVMVNAFEKTQMFGSKIVEIDVKSVPPIQLGEFMQTKPDATMAQKLEHLNKLSRTQFLDRTIPFILALGMDPEKTTIQNIQKID